MQVLSTIDSLQDLLQDWRDDKQTVALVPTLGGLHDGHLCLVGMAQNNADKVVVSIYLNPAQFSENEDFDSYPVTIESDIIDLQKCNVDAVFIPDTEQMYPDGWRFDYRVGDLSSILCGITRPHFFDGVAMAVYRLFEIVKPDIAVFGEKDYQQLFIIKRMVGKLSLGVHILSHSIVREKDGLAMSTRNNYLSVEQRAIAPELSATLSRAKNSYQESKAINNLSETIELELSDRFDVEYVEILDANTLKQITDKTTQIAILCAVLLGSTRLIDNKIFWR